MSSLTDAVRKMILREIGIVYDWHEEATSNMMLELTPLIEAAEAMRNSLSYDPSRLDAEADYDAAVAALTKDTP